MHAAFGYVCYSLGSRLLTGEPPSGGAALALLVGTQLPDLVDKPLSWGLGAFPSGYAVGHSALVALPAGLGALLILHARGRTAAGAGLVVGYWSHLVGDVLHPWLRGGSPAVVRVLWPLVTLPPYDQRLGLAGRTAAYLGELLEGLSGADPLLYVRFLLPVVFAVGLWLADGAPVAAGIVARVRRSG